MKAGTAFSALAVRREAVAAVVLLLALLAVVLPTFAELYQLVWQTDEQGHGPIIIGVAVWLMWRVRHALVALPFTPAPAAGYSLMALGWVAYVLGRSQTIVQLECLGLIVLAVALLLLWRGVAALRLLWFPLFFLLFAVPLPGTVVQALTVPLKSAVSYVAEAALHAAGYPIARSGVTLQIGPYQLLVADACAGLNSLFTLESLGLLYMNLAGYTSRLRNVLLAILIVPISFASNVVRVLILVLITYYFGDAAGQGFVHGFAGMVLFMVALVLMLLTDALLGRTLFKEARA